MGSSIRLLHCIHSVDPAGGGPANFLCELSGLQKELGFQMEVVSLDRPDKARSGRIDCKVYPLGPALPRYGYTDRFVPWLAEHAVEHDVVLVHGIWQFVSFGTWLALRKSEIPYFVYVHGMLDPWFNETYPLKRLKKMLYWPWAEYRVLRDARAVLFTCEEERLLARSSFKPYGCREIVVGHGTRASSGDPVVQREMFFKEFPGLRDKQFLLFLGRVHEKKGVDMLLNAFAAVIAGRQDLHLVVAGPCDGANKQKLDLIMRQLDPDVRSRISFIGMLLGDLKWGAMRSAAAFVLPSHQENFGQSITEALSCGTPVLITNRVNIWREIWSSGAGLVEKDDQQGIINLLQQWLKLSAEQRRVMGLKANLCFESFFELHKAASYLLSILRLEAGAP